MRTYTLWPRDHHHLSRAVTHRRRRIPWHLLLVLWLAVPAWLSAQAPNIDWRRFDWAPTHPVSGAQTAAASGEDWWYDHVTSYNGSSVDGFLCAGYSSFVNWPYDETALGGCVFTQDTDTDCADMETPTNQKGAIVGTLAFIPPGGGSPTWFKTYNEGYFYRVIQTSDGGFLAIGTSAATRRRDNSTPLYYNPNQNPGSLTDQFDLGVACSGPGYSRHMTLVKIDHNGNTQWQYIYGMVPYRDITSSPQPNLAYNNFSDGWDVEEMPDGSFIMVGNANDPDRNLRRACIIRVTSQGYWMWGGFYGPTLHSSTATSIASYGSGAGLRYVVGCMGYFTGTTFNGYTGSNLYQKVSLMQFDGSVVGAPAGPLWNVFPYDNSTNSSQSNYDVRITLNSNNEILWPIIVDCENCLYAGFNQGEGKVYRLNTSGQIIGVTSIGTVTAFDLKVRVHPMADGGYGVVSSKQPACPPDPFDCYGNTRFWRTDAYVARVNDCGELLWDSTFGDGNTVPASYPGNLKLQECMYSISQGADGGFVISGNNSNNFDENYLVKLLPETTPVAGAYIQDTPLDYGYEPNPDTGPMWISSDIWVRNAQDPASFPNAHIHKNPEYRDPILFPGSPNYIYVKVRNRGCDSVVAGSVLKVYAAAASTGLVWPTSWTTNTLCGGQICLGEITSGLPAINVVIGPNAEKIYEIPWFPPDPAGPDAPGGHVCLLARVEKPPYPGMTFTEGANVYNNTRNNNDIAWKNTIVVDELLNAGDPLGLWVANPFNVGGTIRFTFDVPEKEIIDSLFKHFTVTVKIGRTLMTNWKRNGQAGNNITVVDDETIRPTAPGAFLENIKLAAGEKHSITVQFDRKNPDILAPRRTYNLDLKEWGKVNAGEPYRIIGGERYIIKLHTGVMTGALSSVSDDDGGSALLLETMPNPVSGAMTIRYGVVKDGEVVLRLHDAMGREVRRFLNHQRVAGTYTAVADISGLPSGEYLLELATTGGRRVVPVVVQR